MQLYEVSPKLIERVFYYEYESPNASELAKNANAFDSALLQEGKTEPEDWRPAYCVVALGLPTCPPTTETGSAILGTTTATASTVRLTLNANELSTSYYVEYGTSSAYGSATTSVTTSNDVGEQSETVALSGLEPCTTYHYQAEAESAANEGKPSLGGDRTFTTTCSHIIAIAAGYTHSCELFASGGVRCWGDNHEGQLGDGSTQNSTEPVWVAGITTATAITAGINYSCATLADGTIECWGSDLNGQLGDASGESSTTPVPVAGITNAVAVAAAGLVHACAVESGGDVECWGDDEAGQAPALVEGLSGSAMGAGGGLAFTCAVLVSGRVECWGENSVGQLGDGNTTSSSTAVRVSGITTATDVTAAGAGFACATLASGSVECWGGYRLTPEAVSGITTATAVSAGEDVACALLSDGGVDCWENGSSLTPEAVSGITEATAVSVGEDEACAVIAEERVQCWTAV